MNGIFFIVHLKRNSLFSLPVQMYKNSYCTTPSIGAASGGRDVSKMLKFMLNTLCDGCHASYSVHGQVLFVLNVP